MSTESPRPTSGPPLASSWAAPPEFYVDENLAGKTLRRSVSDLGYLVHTPPELFGGREAAEGTADEVWLREVGRHGWVVLGRDLRIFQQPRELAAYRAAQVHVFLFPGQATRATLVELVHDNLADICTTTAGRVPVVVRVTARGLVPLPP